MSTFVKRHTVKDGTTFTWGRDPACLTVQPPHSTPIYYTPQIQGDRLSIEVTRGGDHHVTSAPLGEQKWWQQVEALAYACQGLERP